MRDYFSNLQQGIKDDTDKVESTFQYWKYCMLSIDDNNNRCKKRKVWSDEKEALVCPNSSPTHTVKAGKFDLSNNELICSNCFMVYINTCKECA